MTAERESPHGPRCRHLELNAAITSLSTGPVAIGDGPGSTDRALLLRSCSEDGTLLQPAKPLTAIDAMYDGRQVPRGGFAATGGAQLWTTFSSVPASAPSTTLQSFSRRALDQARANTAAASIHRILKHIDVAGPYSINLQYDFYPGFSASEGPVVYRWNHARALCKNGTHAVTSGCAMEIMPPLDDTARPFLHHFDSHRWSLLHAMPVLIGGWVFTGEVGKWVPVSSTRFRRIASDAHGVLVTLTDTRGEAVHLTALRPHPHVDTVAGSADGNVQWIVATVAVNCNSSSEQTVCIGDCGGLWESNQ